MFVGGEMNYEIKRLFEKLVLLFFYFFLNYLLIFGYFLRFENKNENEMVDK